MIRFKNKIFEQYSICPATGEIFNSITGEVQLVKIYANGRLYFKGMPVHRIMAHTFYGYKPGYNVHHKDENKLNNSLSNLVYLTKSEHTRVHNKGKHLSDEARTKIAAAHKGKSPWKGKPGYWKGKQGYWKGKKGKHHSNETKAKIAAAHKGVKRKPFSNEHRENMRKAALLRWERERKVEVLDIIRS